MSRAAYLDCNLDHRATEWAAIAASAAVIAALLKHVWLDALWSSNVIWFVAAVAFGAVLGDVASGMVHWSLDTWFHPDQPAFSRAVLIAREHHTHPAAILEYPARDYISFSALPTLIFYGPIAWLAIALNLQGLTVASTVLMVSMFFGTHFHGLGHKWSKIPPVRALQRAGLIMSPRHHRKHHNGIHLGYYCTFTGMMNPILDRTGFWRALERFVSSRTGAIPRQDDERRAAEEALALA